MNPTSAEFAFRPLEQTDSALLFRWLNASHMRRFYQSEPMSLEQVEEKYRTRIEGTEPAFCHVALVDARPIGVFQCYLNAAWPEYAEQINADEGVSVDLFIGEPEYLGRGLGKVLLNLYVKEVVLGLFPNVADCYICHEVNNEVAIRASAAAGFVMLREVVEGREPSVLMKRLIKYEVKAL